MKKLCSQELMGNVEAIYLDYYNNYLLIETMAEHYGIRAKTMSRLVELGRKINQSRQ